MARSTRPARSTLRAAGRGVLVAVALAVGVVVVRLLTVVPGYGRTRRGTIALQVVSRMALRALGIRLLSCGSPRSGPALVVANHVCWLDVLVLAAAGPIVPLVDESVLQRPLGPMVSRFGALPLRLRVSRDLSATVEQMTATLRRGHRVLVFPNAQNSTRARESFSRAAFQAAVDAAVVISPAALRYSIPPVTSTERDDVFASLLRILRCGALTVRVTWLPVIPAVAGPGHRADHRAAAARRTEWAIDRALGRTGPTGTTPMPTEEPRPVLALAS